MKIRDNLLACTLALALPLCTHAQLTESEPNNSYGASNEVAEGSTMSGSAGACSPTNNTVDYFKLTTTQVGQLKVRTNMSNDGPTGTVSMTLYNSAVGSIQSFTLNTGVNGASALDSIVFDCRGTGIFYLAIITPPAGCLNYTFDYEMMLPVYGADLEPNSAYNSANTDTVAVNTHADGRINFSQNDDNSDYYILALDDDGLLNINIKAEHPSATATDSLTVSLRNTGASVLKTWRVAIGANSTPFSSDVSMTCRGNGAHYFLSFASDACGTSYRFSYNVTSPVYGNDTENNDAYNSANTDTVAVGVDQDGRLDFYYDDNIDYYAIELNDDGQLNVHVEAEHVSNSITDSLTVRLYNGNSIGVLKTWRVAIGASSIPFTSNVSMTCRGNESRYFLSFSSDACGTSYRFSYDVTPPMYADDNEDNDSYNSANTDTVAVGTDQDGRLNFYYDDNSDYYAIVLNDDGVLNLHVDAEHVSGSTGDSLTIQLRDGNSIGVLKTWRVAIGANSTPFSSDVSMTCRGNGVRYFLSFLSDACGTSYRFNYTVTPPVFANDNEDNDAYNSADTDTVAVGMDQDGRLSFYYDDNSDYFMLALDDDGVLNIHLQAEHVSASTGDSLTVNLRDGYSISVLKTWRVAIGADGTPSDTTIRMTCRGNEARYYLDLHSDACGTSYRFSYDVTPPMFADDLEENDTYNSANTSVIDLDSSPVTGRLNFYYDDNSDYYKVILTAPGTIKIDSRAENANTAGTYDVRLYNSSVSLLESHSFPVGGGSAAASDSWTSATRPAGTYYLQATNAPCGTSYSFDCYDDDNDGVCNAYDLCASTPTGEGVNTDGCSCSQVTVDDGDACTLDECLNGDVTHTFQDADGDLTCDANDLCPNDPNKVAPGECGCGVADTDTDGDLTADCNDLCPNDPNKIAPGDCGCGVADADTDNDGTADCNDLCPNDPNKIAPGTCGCGVADTDTDGDLTADCNDLCPNDPNKIAPGNCGCGNPEPGATCDDGNALTINDAIDANCNCTGTLLTTDCEGVPGGSATIGTSCDDGDANTVNDIYDANCNCVGQALDCEGTPGGTATIGSPCDDGIASTVNDVYDPNCNCAGTLLPVDCEGTPGGTATVGTACDDGDANTVNDLYDANCNCAGQALDCEGTPGGSALPGTACNDGDPNTTNDLWNGACVCAGTPTGGACTQNELSLLIQTDGVSETTWQFVNTSNNAIAASGGYQYPGPGSISENVCLADGCYELRVFDNAGDGISGGGYILSTASGDRIIDNRNNFSTGFLSAIGNGPSDFCLPIGTQNIQWTRRDKLDWVAGEYQVAEPDPAVSAVWIPGGSNAAQSTTTGYQFWFFDPNGTYSFRRFRNHATGDNFGPANEFRACHMKVNNWAVANQIPEYVLMNIRVRSRVNGVYGNWGPASRFKMDSQAATCPATQLVDTPGDPNLSCGQTRVFGSNNYIWARSIRNANKYQFRFRLPAENFVIARTSNTSYLKLNWATDPLLPGRTYDVDVRVSFNNGATWCAIGPHWGGSCTVTIAGGGAASMPTVNSKELEIEEPSVNLWPNPNNGEQLWLSFADLGTSRTGERITTASVDLYDLTGKRVMAREIPVVGSDVATHINVAELANGVYLVHINAGKHSFTERLVISH